MPQYYLLHHQEQLLVKAAIPRLRQTHFERPAIAEHRYHSIANSKKDQQEHLLVVNHSTANSKLDLHSIASSHNCSFNLLQLTANLLEPLLFKHLLEEVGSQDLIIHLVLQIIRLEVDIDSPLNSINYTDCSSLDTIVDHTLEHLFTAHNSNLISHIVALVPCPFQEYVLI